MVPAFISAAVAFVILCVSQWVIHRRERTRMLLGKLEELYELLLQLGDRNGERFDAGLAALLHKRPLPPATLPFEKMIAADLLERTELLISFYFPLLNEDLERIFDANHACVRLVAFDDPIKPSPEYTEARDVMFAFSDEVARLRRRVLHERGVLTREWWSDVKAGFRKATYG